MSRQPRSSSECTSVLARALAGEPLSGQEAAHSFHCNHCQEELQRLQGLASAGQALAALRSPSPQQIDALSATLSAHRDRRTRGTRRALVTATFAVALTIAVVVWPVVPSVSKPAPTSVFTPSNAPLTELLDEVEELVFSGPLRGQIRGRGALELAAADPLQWHVPGPSGWDHWALEYTPVEDLLPTSYGWLSEVLSSSSL